jgi:HPt (histidine-containing phosphotransfer) domain-containing protein
MLELRIQTAEVPDTYPPDALARPIDMEHLFRMTLGDQHLLREVLRLFDRQIEMLLPRIVHSRVTTTAAAVAHTLKGSARGIGAWRVAQAAEAVERTAGDLAGMKISVENLAATAEETRAAIAELLREGN